MNRQPAVEAASASDALLHRDTLRELIGWLDQQHQQRNDALAAQVHTELGSALTALTMRLALLARQVGSASAPAESAAHWEKVHALMMTITESTRDIQRQLRPFAVDALGLTVSLEHYVEHFGQRTGIACTISATGVPPDLPDDDAHAVLRLVQEALANVEQHAHATKVDVQLTSTSAGCEIVIADDGAGFDPQALDENRSHGLRLMRERAALLRAQLTIHSAPAQGCRVGIALPP